MIKNKQLFKITICAGTTFFISLLLLEIVLRVFPSLMPRPVRYMISLPSFWHPIVGVAQEANTHSLLSQDEFTFSIEIKDFGSGRPGFRDEPLGKEQPIIVLGDSFTWGVGVDRRFLWTELLEEETGVNFVNMAYCGYGTTQERLVLEHWGLRLKPKGVIIQLTYNDLSENEYWISSFNINKGRICSAMMEVRSWLFKNSRTYELFKFYVLGALLHRGAYADLFARDARTSLFKEVSFGSARVNIAHSFPLPFRSEFFGSGWKIMKQELVRIKNICLDNKAWLVVLVVPVKEQVYSMFYGLSPSEADVFNNEVSKFCNLQGIFFLDPTAFLREHAHEQIYWKNDGHFTEAGQRVIFNFLKDSLHRLYLL